MNYQCFKAYQQRINPKENLPYIHESIIHVIALNGEIVHIQEIDNTQFDPLDLHHYHFHHEVIIFVLEIVTMLEKSILTELHSRSKYFEI